MCSRLKIGFIGTGTMGAAVASVVAGAEKDCELLFSNRTEEKAVALARELHGEVGDNLSIAAQCDYIFLGVKPQGLSGLLEELSPILRERGEGVTLVSMLAGVKISRILDLAGGDVEVIRMMPNTPLLVGHGVVLYCGSRTESVRLERFGQWMSHGGVADLVPESMMDAGSALSGCGPAFFAMFVEALADGAVCCGVPREQALRYAAQTMVGTGEMMLQMEKHPALVKDGVCSPAGSTIRGVSALEACGLRRAGIEAVVAAYERTKELGEGS